MEGFLEVPSVWKKICLGSLEWLAQDIMEQDIIEKIGGCGAELNREIVSRCVVCLVRSGSGTFPCSFSPFPRPQSPIQLQLPLWASLNI